jgi:2-C-methyl-D-erythritol 4-phosphate cytidylyltransferase
MNPFAVILPAAGRSTRFGPANKLSAELDGQAVLERTLTCFVRRSEVSLILVPCSDSAIADIARRGGEKVILCPGGHSRAHSVQSALKMVPASIDWVAIHDAARPLASPALIDRVFAAAQRHGAAAPALPVHLTIKQANGPLPARIVRTIPRNTLFAMQTPQAMRRVDLLQAYQCCPLPLEQITDDVQLLELAGLEVWLVEGDEQNLKITTATDLKLAQTLLNDRENPPRGHVR